MDNVTAEQRQEMARLEAILRKTRISIKAVHVIQVPPSSQGERKMPAVVEKALFPRPSLWNKLLCERREETVLAILPLRVVPEECNGPEVAAEFCRAMATVTGGNAPPSAFVKTPQGKCSVMSLNI